MSTDNEQLLSAALALPEDDRLQLVEALIDSLQPEDVPAIDDSWHEVISRRSAELRSGKATPIPWEDVRKQGREKVGS